jgi:hypothetical protein
MTGPRRETKFRHPFVKSLPAITERLLAAGIRSGDESIE